MAQVRLVTDVSLLLDHELQRELMRHLSGIHDKGGRSLDRSIESRLLSAAHWMHENVYGENAIDSTAIPRDVLELEAMRRAIVMREPELLLFRAGDLVIAALPDWWLLAELMNALVEFYQADSHRDDALSVVERDLACITSFFSPAPNNEPLFTSQELLREVENRRWRLRELIIGPPELW